MEIKSLNNKFYNQISKLKFETKDVQVQVANMLKRIAIIEKYNRKLRKDETKRVEYLRNIKSKKDRKQKPLMTMRSGLETNFNIQPDRQSKQLKTMKSLEDFRQDRQLIKMKIEKNKQKIKQQNLLKHFKIRKQKQNIKESIAKCQDIKREQAKRVKTERVQRLVNKKYYLMNLKQTLQIHEKSALSELEESICRHKNIKDQIQELVK